MHTPTKAATFVAGCAALFGLALLPAQEAEAGEGCKVTVYVTSGFEKNIRTTKGEHGNPKSWRQAWSGEEVIEPSKALRKIFTVPKSCDDEGGTSSKWNLRVTRKNGKQHLCMGLSTTSKVRLKPGGGCEVKVAGG
jgi:hypothetical protein